MADRDIPPNDRLVFGGTTLGGRHVYSAVDEAQAIETVHAAFDAGMRTFDTAPFYGLGQGEIRMGKALASLPRDTISVSSKVGRWLDPITPSAPDDAPFAPRLEYTYDAAFGQLDASLERMGLTRLDIVYVHDVDNDVHFDTARDGSCRALAEMKAAGRIRAFGAGVGSAAIAERFVRETDIDLLMLACRYTLAEQTALERVFPTCLERGVAVIVAAPFASGILATGPKPGARFNYGVADDLTLNRIGRIKAACTRHGVPLRAAALQFPLLHPAVRAISVGAKTPDEVRENLCFSTMKIPSDLWRDLRSERLIDPRAPIPH